VRRGELLIAAVACAILAGGLVYSCSDAFAQGVPPPSSGSSFSGSNAGLFSTGDAGVANQLGVGNNLEVKNNIDAGSIIAVVHSVSGAGSSSNCSIQPYGDPNTGITFPAADTINTYTAGTLRTQTDAAGKFWMTAAADVADLLTTVTHTATGKSNLNPNSGVISDMSGGDGTATVTSGARCVCVCGAGSPTALTCAVATTTLTATDATCTSVTYWCDR
jgi:hypothetical protein